MEKKKNVNKKVIALIVVFVAIAAVIVGMSLRHGDKKDDTTMVDATESVSGTTAISTTQPPVTGEDAGVSSSFTPSVSGSMAPGGITESAIPDRTKPGSTQAASGAPQSTGQVITTTTPDGHVITTSEPGDNHTVTTVRPDNGQVTTVRPGVGQTPTKTPTKNPTKAPSTPVQTEDTKQSDEEKLYNQLFDINNKITIKLDISDDEIKKLQSDYVRFGSGKSDIYRMADKVTITIAGKSYVMNEVGVRMKGNTSRSDVYRNGNIDNRNLIHFRLSFDETFDDKDDYGNDVKNWKSDSARKERKKRTFATLSGLELKWNRCFDGTYVANYYSHQMFKGSGVLAQSMNLANINFGGYNYGVYSIYEPVDKTFIERYVAKKDQGGDLYKCAWGQTSWGNWSGATYTTDVLGSIGIETPYEQYVYDLKTNKKSSTHSALKYLINTLNSNPSASKFSSVVDTDEWVKFAAASYFAGNPDDMRNNYNNHYVYFLKSSGKAVFIPYDNDRVFGLSVENIDKMYEANPFSEWAKLAGQKQENPLYIYSVIRKKGSTTANNCSSGYIKALASIAGSKWMKYSTFENYYKIAKKNYEDCVIPDSNVRATIGETSNLSFSDTRVVFRGDTTVKNYMNSIMNTYRSNS